jgi:hypothetical protein
MVIYCMEKTIRIKKRLEKFGEPFCGPITYCAISDNNPTNVERFHRKGSIKPSLGFFYLSFHKLDAHARTFVERNDSMLDSKDIKCFDSMWKFEKSFQKISKEEFVKETLRYNRKLFEKYKKNIKIFSKMSRKDYRNIISDGISSDKAVGVMIMNKYRRNYFIPHWITVHGLRGNAGKNEYLIFNPYFLASEWWPENKLFGKIDMDRKYHFSPQIVIVKKRL